MSTLYLSRRNLLTLLSKLDRKANGEISSCSIVKHDTVHPKYPCTHLTVVTALEDHEYYYERESGLVHPSDTPKEN